MKIQIKRDLLMSQTLPAGEGTPSLILCSAAHENELAREQRRTGNRRMSGGFQWGNKHPGSPQREKRRSEWMAIHMNARKPNLK